MELTIKPALVDLFGTNPRWVEVSRTAANFERVQMTVNEVDPAGGGATIVSLENYFDAGKAIFNVSRLLPLEYHLPSNSFAHFAQTTATSSVKNYQLVFQEFEAGSNTPQNTASMLGYAALGGRDVLTNRVFNFWEDHVNVGKFLTLQPREKLVTKAQPEWLTFLSAYDGFLTHHNTLMVEVFFSDDTSQELTVFAFDSEFGASNHFTVGYHALNLSSLETADKYVLYWQVWFKSYDSDPIQDNLTERFTFRLDYEEQAWEHRYFLFQNSLGGFDTLCTRGKATVISKQQRSSRSVVEFPNTAYASHPVRSNPVETQREVKVNVGWLERPERQWCEELAGSPNVWQLDLAALSFIPILITSNNLPIHQDDEDLQSSAFTFRYPQNFAR